MSFCDGFPLLLPQLFIQLSEQPWPRLLAMCCAIIPHKHSAVLFRYGTGNAVGRRLQCLLQTYQRWNYVRNQPCKVVYKKNLMQWNNVAFSFLWLFTGLCLSAVSFCAEKRRISLGVGDGGFSAWCLSTQRSLVLSPLWNSKTYPKLG